MEPRLKILMSNVLKEEWKVVAFAAGDSYQGDPTRHAEAIRQGEADEYDLRVLQHADGRLIVHGMLIAAPSAWGAPANGECRHAGELVACQWHDLISAIQRVGQECRLPPLIICECIADLSANHEPQ